MGPVVFDKLNCGTLSDAPLGRVREGREEAEGDGRGEGGVRGR
jgi:hypothetical protein